MMQITYTKRPFGSIDALSCALSIDARHLVRLSERADSFYYVSGQRKKDDGSTRLVYGVKPPLSDIQKRVVEVIFRQVCFPPYLHGSIKDVDRPRSAITDAAQHMGKRIVVSIDVLNFFPSLKRSAIHVTWQRLFNFPEDVAAVLTGLTTMAGSLPQGAHTSPGLGNLIFWDREPQIEQRIRNLGFTYTRYVDDVTISTNRFVRMSELQSVISPVVGMLSSKGVRPHRGQDKLVIATPGYQRQVHGLNVGSGALTMDRRDRAKIRAAVHQCELQAQAGLNAIEYARNWLSVNGRIEWLRLFHPTPAEQYQDRMNAIKPVLSEELFDEVEGDVNTLEQLASAWTLPFDYRREYKKVSRRVNTLQAYYPGKFSPLIQRLRLLSEN